MNIASRCLTLTAASLAVACAARSAVPDQTITWSLHADEPKLAEGKVQLKLRLGEQGRQSSYDQDFKLPSLVGLSAESLRAGSSRDVSFRYSQQAGRLDCSGAVRARNGAGECSLAGNPHFADELARRGIAKPDRQELFNLTVAGAELAVLDELKRQGYPQPDIDGLVALSIFKVTPSDVRDLAASGYRLASVGDLVQFKIFDVTPEYIRELHGLGYRDIAAKDLVQFKIFKVTPAFVRELRGLGYADVPPAQLVQLKIFNVTPEYIRSLTSVGRAPDLGQIARLRMAGVDPSRRKRAR